MEVINLFKEALTYPTKDLNKVLLLGVLFVITGLVSILQVFGLSLGNNSTASIITTIFGIISIIVTLFIYGYGLNITRKTIALEAEIPDFNWAKDIVDGIKLLILEIVYYIIPVIVTLIVAYVTGAFNYLIQIMSYSMLYGSTNAIPESVLVGAATSFLIVFFIGAILFIIFTLLVLIAIGKLAETGSLGAAINMKDVFNKIGEIGWGNYIVWIVVYVLILFVIGIILGIIQLIPFIGIIIGLLLISPYIQMFSSRALGLIYNESK
jgi:hypothetical protein